jgi:hypothetical protein
MTAKEYLSQIKVLSEKIRGKELELQAAEITASGLSGMRYDEPKVMSSPSDKLSNDVVNCLAIIDEINTQRLHYLNIKHMIIDQIQNLDNPDHVKILTLRFVEFKRFNRVITDMMMSKSETYRTYNEALESFEKKYLP